MKLFHVVAIIILIFPVSVWAQSPLPPLDTNVVALWHFDEGSGNILHDASPYHNDGVIHNATWVEGKFGSALHFDGLTSYVIIPNSASLKTENEFTIEVWVSLDTLNFAPPPNSGEGAAVLSCLGSYPYGGGYGMGFFNNEGFHFNYRIPGSGGYITPSGSLPTLREFFHIAIVYKRVTTNSGQVTVVKSYRNGELTDSSVFAGSIHYAGTPYFYIGTEVDGRALGSWARKEFPGIIDEIRISKVARTPDDFDLPQNSSIDFNTVALWHFDEGTGNVLHDASSYHNDGEIHNAGWVAGKFGSGLHFNGLTSYVVLPNSSSLRIQKEFTLEAWISLDTLAFDTPPPPDYGFGVILSNLGPYPYGGGYQINLRNNGGFRFEDRAIDGNSYFSGFTPVNQSHHFYHVAVVYKELTPTQVIVKTYFDDVLTDSAVIPQPIQYNSTPNFYIGTNRDGRAVGSLGVREFPGIIDEIRISKIALQPGEFGVSQLTVSRHNVDFGLIKVSENATQSITLSNTSFTQSLHIDSMTISDPHFTANQSPFVLSPLSNRPLDITYTPTATQVDTGFVTLHVSDPGVPSVTIQLAGKGFAIGSSPIIKSVRDVPDDQGKQVRVTWFASIYDDQGQSELVNQYSIWRRVDDPWQKQAHAGEASIIGMRGSTPRYMMVNGELWDFITTLPAVRFSEYAYVAPTLANATQLNLHWSVFRVAAHATNGDFFFSDPDSGYSSDNNFPPPPFLVATMLSGRVALSWSSSAAPDVESYRVYRSTSPNLVPSIFSRIGVTTKSTFEDSTTTRDSTYFYTVTAVDSSGNESAQSNNTPGVRITGVGNNGSTIPHEYVLSQNYPNPFNPSTAITYGVPTVSRVHLVVYNVLGQTVAMLIDGIVEPGFHDLQWKPEVSSGVYFYKFEATSISDPAQSFARTGKMMLIK